MASLHAVVLLRKVQSEKGVVVKEEKASRGQSRI